MKNPRSKRHPLSRAVHKSPSRYSGNEAHMPRLLIVIMAVILNPTPNPVTKHQVKARRSLMIASKSIKPSLITHHRLQHPLSLSLSLSSHPQPLPTSPLLPPYPLLPLSLPFAAMSSSPALMRSSLSMVESSLPTLFPSSKPSSLPFLPFPAKPTTFLHLSLSSPSISLRKKLPLVPLVAQTSDWAQQEEEENEVGLAPEGTEASLSDWEGAEAAVEGGVVEEGVEEEEAEEEAYQEPPEEAKLFVGNLPYDMDSENLAQLFDKAGVVEVAEVIYNRETDQSRGFGFVTMSTVEEAEKAVEMLNRYDVNGRLLTVNKAAPRGARVERTQESAPSFRMYVGNLPWQVDDSRLEQVFSEHGKVVDARVVYDRETGRSRGFGFVTMATQNELDDAIAALDGQSLDGRALRVNIAENRPRRSF